MALLDFAVLVMESVEVAVKALVRLQNTVQRVLVSCLPHTLLFQTELRVASGGISSVKCIDRTCVWWFSLQMLSGSIVRVGFLPSSSVPLSALAAARRVFLAYATEPAPVGSQAPTHVRMRKPDFLFFALHLGVSDVGFFLFFYLSHSLLLRD